MAKSKSIEEVKTNKDLVQTTNKIDTVKVPRKLKLRKLHELITPKLIQAFMVGKQEYFIDKCKYIWTGEKKIVRLHNITSRDISNMCKRQNDSPTNKMVKR
jgi:hypothetical protein